MKFLNLTQINLADHVTYARPFEVIPYSEKMKQTLLARNRSEFHFFPFCFAPNKDLPVGPEHLYLFKRRVDNQVIPRECKQDQYFFANFYLKSGFSITYSLCNNTRVNKYQLQLFNRCLFIRVAHVGPDDLLGLLDLTNQVKDRGTTLKFPKNNLQPLIAYHIYQNEVYHVCTNTSPVASVNEPKARKIDLKL